MKFLSDVRLLLLGLWLGAAVYFIAVAQSAFAVLPSRELAGALDEVHQLLVPFLGHWSLSLTDSASRQAPRDGAILG